MKKSHYRLRSIIYLIICPGFLIGTHFNISWQEKYNSSLYLLHFVHAFRIYPGYRKRLLHFRTDWTNHLPILKFCLNQLCCMVACLILRANISACMLIF